MNKILPIMVKNALDNAIIQFNAFNIEKPTHSATIDESRIFLDDLLYAYTRLYDQFGFDLKTITDSVRDVKTFLDRSHSGGLPEPKLSTTDVGHVMLTWKSDFVQVQLVFCGDGTYNGSVAYSTNKFTALIPSSPAYYLLPCMYEVFDNHFRP